MTIHGMKAIPARSLLLSRLSYCPMSGVLQWRGTRQGPNTGSNVAGCVKPRGYRYLFFDAVEYAAHRVIWVMMTGEDPRLFIDHINGDPSDNRWANLRLASHAENMRNCRIPRHNTSGIKGVRYDKERALWRAEIKANGRKITLGRFNTAQAASAAYDAAAVKLHGDFVRRTV